MTALNKINFEFPMWESVEWPKEKEEENDEIKELVEETKPEEPG